MHGTRGQASLAGFMFGLSIFFLTMDVVGVAVRKQDVFLAFLQRVLVIKKEGQVLRQWGAERFERLRGIAVLDQEIFVSDEETMQVYRFDGSFVRAWATSAGRLAANESLLFGARGEIVQAFCPKGHLRFSFETISKTTAVQANCEELYIGIKYGIEVHTVQDGTCLRHIAFRWNEPCRIKLLEHGHLAVWWPKTRNTRPEPLPYHQLMRPDGTRLPKLAVEHAALLEMTYCSFIFGVTER